MRKYQIETSLAESLFEASVKMRAVSAQSFWRVNYDATRKEVTLNVEALAMLLDTKASRRFQGGVVLVQVNLVTKECQHINDALNTDCQSVESYLVRTHHQLQEVMQSLSERFATTDLSV